MKKVGNLNELKINCKTFPNTILENLYIEYCEFLGFTANEKGSFNVERKYWEAFNID